MRVGLYGLPTAGKTYILDRINNLKVLSGSSLLREMAPGFNDMSENEKKDIRKRLAISLTDKDNFIMDGHYSFGDKVVFTQEDGSLYDVFLYLYINPDILEERLKESERNRKYLKYDIESWQYFEIESLREHCHKNNKDFYVLDNPPKGFFSDIDIILEFIENIKCGFSGVNYAKHIIKFINSDKNISLIDGDRTLIIEDSSSMLGYRTHLFDGNFYTGFQSWRHSKEFTKYLEIIDYKEKNDESIDVNLNTAVFDNIVGTPVVLTSGHLRTWENIVGKYDMKVFGGEQMCSDTKFFVTKFLQEQGKVITAFGDSMNDYYMLKQANKSFLVLKKDGTISSSLKNRSMEGIAFV